MLEKKWFKVSYWMFVGLLGFIFIFLMPPFQKNDEIAHYYRAMSVARGEFFCKNIAPDISYSFYLSEKYYELPYFLQAKRIMFDASKKFPISMYKADFSELEKFNGVEYIGLCQYPFFGYIPMAIGLIFGYLLKNYLVMFFAGRLFGFLFFICCLYLSIRLADKRLRPILYFYGVIPMVLHQASAISYDVMMLSMTPLIFTFLSRSSFDKKLNIKFLLGLMFSLSLLFFSRPGFPLLMLLLLLVPWKKISDKFWKYLLVLGVFYGINYLFYRLLGNYYGMTSGENPEANSVIFSVIQKDNLFVDLRYFLKALTDAIYVNGGYYIRELIAIFGSRDTSIVSDYLHYFYIAMAGLLFWWQLRGTDKKKNGYGWMKIILLSLIVFGTIVSIFYGFYANYASVGQTYIYGVQGRYFLVVVPFFYLLLNQIFQKLGSELSKKLVLLVFGLFILGNIVQSIYLRFYDYSKFYSNPNDMRDSVSELVNSKVKKIEYITIDKTISFEISKVQNHKVGGFEILISTGGKLMYIPYKYQLLDSNCTRTVKSGLLKQEGLGDGIYSEDFGKTRLFGGVCLELTPIGDVSKLKEVNYLMVAKEPIVLKYIWD